MLTERLGYWLAARFAPAAALSALIAGGIGISIGWNAEQFVGAWLVTLYIHLVATHRQRD